MYYIKGFIFYFRINIHAALRTEKKPAKRSRIMEYIFPYATLKTIKGSKQPNWYTIIFVALFYAILCCWQYMQMQKYEFKIGRRRYDSLCKTYHYSYYCNICADPNTIRDFKSGCFDRNIFSCQNFLLALKLSILSKN